MYCMLILTNNWIFNELKVFFSTQVNNLSLILQIIFQNHMEINQCFETKIILFISKLFFRLTVQALHRAM